jgi:CheY-specific phosphatase CheX
MNEDENHMQQKLMKALKMAVLRTFSREFLVDLTLVNEKKEKDKIYDISGIAGFIVDTTGSIALRISESTAWKMKNRLVIERIIQSKNILEAICELVSMVAGNVIMAFNNKKNTSFNASSNPGAEP